MSRSANGNHGRVVTSLSVMALLLAACSVEQAPDGGSASVAENANKETSAQDAVSMDKEAESKPAIQPPSPDSVLYLIYQKDGDGATAYEVANGAWATYWHGHSFELDGKQYFVGLAHATRERFPADGELASGPDDQVDLSEATFVLTDESDEPSWRFVGAEPYIGKFGGYDKGNSVDGEREAQEYKTPDGRLLLAVPAWSLQSGVRIESFDLFVFNPAEELPIDERHWTYVGNAYTGEDNSAACDEGGEGLACVKNSGTLQFVPQDGNPMPTLRVERSGNTIEGPGQVRALTPEDTVEYHFDADNRGYAAEDL